MLHSETILAGTYDLRFVALSVLIAALASYAALDLGGRVTASHERLRLLWVIGGASAMGTGIWSMHYVGMLAYSLPVLVLYDWPTVLWSLLAAVGAAAIALFVVSRKEMGPLAIGIGGLLMGIGIAAMHYIGMEAMRLPAMCHYSPGIVFLSVVLAIVISLVALWLTFHLRADTRSLGWRRLTSTVLMGLAIPVMHYTGMAAVTFTPMASHSDLSHSVQITALGTVGIVGVSLTMLILAILTSFVDRRFSLVERANAQLASIVENADAAIISKDMAGTVLTWNRGAERIYGYSAEEMTGRTMAALVPSDRCAEEANFLSRLRRGERINHVETVRLTKPGEPIPILLTLSPIQDRRGNFLGIAHVAEDMTHVKKLEQRLAQTQKLESIGQLAAGIAHEINTPIQYIGDNGIFLRDAFRDLVKFADARRDCEPGSGIAGLAFPPKKTLDEDVFKYLQDEVPMAIEQLLEGVDQVSRIVLAMKEFSHPGPAEKIPVDINRAIESTVLVSKSEWKLLAELTTDFDRELPPVPCLAGEFNQVILNLIVNAAHAIGDVVKDSGGMGRIRITTRRDGDAVEIRVSDTGCGIPKANQPKVFDPFFTTKAVGKGTGQGLAIAYGVIVQKHDGTIQVESEPGSGTTFIIRLPLVQELVAA